MSGGLGLTRRVSRVESLRRLLLGASQQEARRLFDRRKQRYTVDKAIGESREIDTQGHSQLLSQMFLKTELSTTSCGVVCGYIRNLS